MNPQSDLPRVFPVRQRFPRPRLDDPAAAVESELSRLLADGRRLDGASVGITVGSRGITAIAGLVRAVVEFLRTRGARPVILPAMGSHGGARAEGQAHLISHFGITEETMGCPIHAAMETRSLGTTPDGVEVHMAEAALALDGILLMNRVKPHTDYKGDIESGLTKICAIGLGKYHGARELHRHVFDVGLGEAIRQATARMLGTGKILGGLAIFENAYHETARLAVAGADELFEREARFLEEARGLMGRLPLDEVDLLVCDRMGKNISGAGLDTNVIGRSVYGFVPGVPWCDGMPSVLRIAVRELSSKSDGNAVGMGMVDFVTERFMAQVDRPVTYLNSLTACAPGNARTPIVLPSDREALVAALRTCPRRAAGPILVHVRDTLNLVDAWLSEACLPLVSGREDVEILAEPQPMSFDAEGSLISPFARAS